MQGVHGLYAIFSQCTFVPGDEKKWAKPFARFFEQLRRDLLSYPGEEEAVLGSFDRRHADLLPFVPGLGRVHLDLKHNPFARLFFKLPSRYDPEPRGKPWGEPREYVSSGELFKLLHIPLQVSIKKKVTAAPSFAAMYPAILSGGYSENWGLKLRIYEAGFLSVLLHVSIATQSALTAEATIDWLRAVKSAERSDADRPVAFRFRNVEFPDIRALIEGVIHETGRALFPWADKSPLSHLRDMVRLKPIQSLSSTNIQRISGEICLREWKYSDSGRTSFPVKFGELLQGVDDDLAGHAGAEGWLDQFYSLAPHRHTPSGVRAFPDFADPSSAWAAVEVLKRRQRDLPAWIESRNLPTRDEAERDSTLWEKIAPAHRYSTALHRLTKVLHDELLKKIRKTSLLALDDREILGLITKEFNWRELRRPRGGFESFGRYSGDVIVAGPKSIVMASDHWSTRKKLQLWFQWKLHAVAELAFFQIETGNALSRDPGSPAAARVFADSLALTKHLSPRFRRWYHRISEAVGLEQMASRVAPEQSYSTSQGVRTTDVFQEEDHRPPAHDVFISYAREDESRAAMLAEKLVEAGFSVWWDRRLAPGEWFGRSIETALFNARCVVVLWTKHSVVKRWVLAEAEEGAKRRILVPLRYDQVTVPLGFRPIQAIDIMADVYHRYETFHSLDLRKAIEDRIGSVVSRRRKRGSNLRVPRSFRP